MRMPYQFRGLGGGGDGLLGDGCVFEFEFGLVLVLVLVLWFCGWVGGWGDVVVVVVVSVA